MEAEDSFVKSLNGLRDERGWQEENEKTDWDVGVAEDRWKEKYRKMIEENRGLEFCYIDFTDRRSKFKPLSWAKLNKVQSR